MNKNLAIEYLTEFKEVAAEWFQSHNFLSSRLSFFKEFMLESELQKAEWPYFQALGNNINSFATNPLAKGNALGRPNHEIEHYRLSFINLLHSSEPIEIRIDNFIKNVFLFNISSTSEIIGNCFPSDYVFFNGKNKAGANILSINPGYARGDSNGIKFIKFNNAIKPLLTLYNEIVGMQTSTHINLEIDQFLLWLAETKNQIRYWAGGYHWDDGEENMFDEFIEEGYWQIGWGKEDEKGTSSYRIIKDIKVGDYLALKSLGGQHDLKISAIGEVVDNSEKEEGKLGIEWIHTTDIYTGKAPKGQNAGNWFGTLLEVKRPADINIFFKDLTNNNIKNNNKVIKNPMNLNTILYGPPGTGKTYKSIAIAVSIANPSFFESNNITTNANSYSDEQYKLILSEFNNLKSEGRIELITFHQNYSYEDFIQGIKPDVTNTQLSFKKVDGIFKKTVVNALIEHLKSYKNQNTPKEQNKIGFDSLYESMINTWHSNKETIFKTKTGKEVVLKSKNEEYDLKFAHRKLTHYNIEAKKWIEGDSQPYDVSRDRIKRLYESFTNKKEFDNIISIDKSIRERIGGCNTTIFWVVINELFKVQEFWDGDIQSDDVFEEYDSLSYEAKVIEVNNYISEGNSTKESLPFVFIIDEINRANISRVFGDLITLIETDKRWGNKHQLVVKLPSGDLFTVPNNLYIIGTMNTADKSIALLDIALRRRFSFLPLYPDYNLMGDYEKIIKPLNEKLYDLKKSPDFMIGHSFFIGKTFNDKEVSSIFNENVIPLLYEYLPHYKAIDIKNLLTQIGVLVEEPNINNNYQLKCNGKTI